jgi:hypothetical protein
MYSLSISIYKFKWQSILCVIKFKRFFFNKHFTGFEPIIFRFEDKRFTNSAKSVKYKIYFNL